MMVRLDLPRGHADFHHYSESSDRNEGAAQASFDSTLLAGQSLD
jgi:hypothetical protein